VLTPAGTDQSQVPALLKVKVTTPEAVDDVGAQGAALDGPAGPNTSAVATSDTTTAPIAAIRPAPRRRSVLVFPRDPISATSPSQDPSRCAESLDDLKRSIA
jgi:hypothetical protein